MASYAFAPDNYDSDDDSEFGFDDGLSSDEVLLSRIAKMRSIMTLVTDSDSEEAPPATTTTTPLAPLPEAAREAPPAAVIAEEKQDDDELKDDLIDDDEFLLVDPRTTQEPPLPPPQETAQPQEKPPRASLDDQAEIGAEEEEDTDDDDDGYVVTWAKGQLGLLFKAGPRGQTIIRRISKRSSSADGLHVARVGDVLVALNGERVTARSCQDIVEQLRLPDFPVTLSFQPHKPSDDDDDDDDDVDDQGDLMRASEMPGNDMARKESAQSVLSTASTVPTSRANESTSSSTSVGPNGHAYPSSGLGPSPAYRLQQQAPPPPSAYSGAGAPPSYSRSSTLDDSPGPGEYDVVWRHGSLGCGVKKSNGLPAIKSVTPGTAVDDSVQQIATGDVMVRINGMDTDAIGFRAVVDTMQRAPKPLFMRFRRADYVTPPPPRSSYGQPPRPSRYESSEFENLRESRVAMDDLLAGALTSRQYTVLWNDGPLGVQIKPRPSDGSIVVTKFTGTGNPELLAPISLGDLFVRIAGLEVAELGITGTYEKLKTVHKPVVLVFERPFPEVSPQYPTPPSPLPAPPPVLAPVVRQGFATDDRQDSAAVPSFRELREREAAANQGRHDSFAGFTAGQREETAFGATGRRAALAKHRPASYDMQEHHGSDGPRSRNSFQHTDNSSGDGRHQDPSGSGDGAGTTGELPRFSDIEKGRVKTTTVASLPPPPAYHDTFSQSGRFLDPNQFGDAPQPPLSPRSEERPGSSVSSGQGRAYGGGGGGGGPPPAYLPSYGYTAPTPPRQAPTPYGMSTPPVYDQYSAPRGGGGGGGYGSERIDVLRQQYIESERMRNQPPLRGGGGATPRENALTEMSTYSDLDDSGVMAAMRRPADRGSRPSAGPSGRQQPSLPAPELWIQWKEGPLGITFRRTNGQIVVSRLTGAGYSRGLEQLRAGDWLVSFGNPGVGSYATSELRLAETMELIKTLPKPVDMRFVVR